MKVGDASRNAQAAVKSAASRAAKTVGEGFDETYGKRARQAGGAVKRFVKKTYTSGG